MATTSHRYKSVFVNKIIIKSIKIDWIKNNGKTEQFKALIIVNFLCKKKKNWKNFCRNLVYKSYVDAKYVKKVIKI